MGMNMSEWNLDIDAWPGPNRKKWPGVAWHLYVIRTVKGSLYAGIATDVRRRYQEHATGSPKAARFLRAQPPRGLVLTRRIGSRSLALKVEYRFKQLTKRDKEAIIRANKLRFDRESGQIRR
jgi:putative endonuclease